MIGSKFMGRAHSNAYAKVARFFDLPVEPVMHTVAARATNDLAAFASRWGWQNWTTRWALAVENPDVDLVDICTPNYVHLEHAIAALARGMGSPCEVSGAAHDPATQRTYLRMQ